MVKAKREAMRNTMMTKYTHNAHATWKHAPMKPAREITSTTNPITKSGVWKKFSQVVVLLAIHRPAPMMGIDAKRVKKFKNPITVLLNRCISHTLLVSQPLSLFSLSSQCDCDSSWFLKDSAIGSICFYFCHCIKVREFQHSYLLFCMCLLSREIRNVILSFLFSCDNDCENCTFHSQLLSYPQSGES